MFGEMCRVLSEAIVVKGLESSDLTRDKHLNSTTRKQLSRTVGRYTVYIDLIALCSQAQGT